MKTETNGAAAVLAAFWGLVCSYCLRLLVPLIVLLFVVLLDYATGMAKAWKRGELNTHTGLMGILKKLGYAVIVCVSGVVDWLISYGLAQAGIDLHLPFLLSMVVICWLIINELISILENVAAFDGPVPPWLGKLLNRIKKTVDEKAEPETEFEIKTTELKGNGKMEDGEHERS